MADTETSPMLSPENLTVKQEPMEDEDSNSSPPTQVPNGKRWDGDKDIAPSPTAEDSNGAESTIDKAQKLVNGFVSESQHENNNDLCTVDKAREKAKLHENHDGHHDDEAMVTDANDKINGSPNLLDEANAVNCNTLAEKEARLEQLLHQLQALREQLVAQQQEAAALQRSQLQRQQRQMELQRLQQDMLQRQQQQLMEQQHKIQLLTQAIQTQSSAGQFLRLVPIYPTDYARGGSAPQLIVAGPDGQPTAVNVAAHAAAAAAAAAKAQNRESPTPPSSNSHVNLNHLSGLAQSPPGHVPAVSVSPIQSSPKGLLTIPHASFPPQGFPGSRSSPQNLDSSEPLNLSQKAAPTKSTSPPASSESSSPSPSTPPLFIRSRPMTISEPLKRSQSLSPKTSYQKYTAHEAEIVNHASTGLRVFQDQVELTRPGMCRVVVELLHVV